MTDRSQNPRGRSSTIWLVFAAALVLLVTGYVAWYFLGAVYVFRHKSLGIRREYSSGAVARLFIPAAWFESRIRGESVGVNAMKHPAPTEPNSDPFEFYRRATLMPVAVGWLASRSGDHTDPESAASSSGDAAARVRVECRAAVPQIPIKRAILGEKISRGRLPTRMIGHRLTHSDFQLDERSIKTMRPCINLLRPGAVTLYKFPHRRDYPVLLLTRRTLRQYSRQIMAARRTAPQRVDFRHQPSALWRPRG